jgi:hypothetical protein
MKRLCCLAALALAGCAPPVATVPPLSRALAVVTASKLASGGSAWDLPHGCFEQGTHGDGAVSYKTWFNLRRYGMRVESERAGSKRVMGFNGRVSWMVGPGGQVVQRDDADSLQEAINTAYLSNNAFFFPDRFPADFKYLREAIEGGTAFDVLEVTPRGGRPMELWFDRGTHLLGRVVDTDGKPPMRVTAGDYRRVDKMAVAFALDVSAPDGKIADRGRLTSISCGPIDEKLFDPPVAGD